MEDSSGNDSGIITGGWSRSTGAGVKVQAGGVFTLNGGNIYDNVGTTAASFGGGVFVRSQGEFNMSGGTLAMNGKSTNLVGNPSGKYTINEKDGGAVYVRNGGVFNMTGGAIDGALLGGGSAGAYNYARQNGGAVYVGEGSKFTMSGNAYISQGESNTGSVYLAGELVMKDNAKIDKSRGPAVWIAAGGKLYMNDDSVIKDSNNSGVVVNEDGYFEMNGGVIGSEWEISQTTGVEYTYGNSASVGGGVNVQGGCFVMNDGAIIGNSAAYAGGVYVKSGSFTMNDGEIRNNRVVTYNSNSASTGNGDGGGVWVGVDGAFDMTGGSITGNRTTWLVYDDEHPELNARDYQYGVGGGVFVQSSENNYGSFSLSDAPVIQNNYIGSPAMSAVHGLITSNVYMEDTGGYYRQQRMINTGVLENGAKIGLTPVPKGSGGQVYVSGLLNDSVDSQTFTDSCPDNNGDAFPFRFFTADLPDYVVVKDANGEAMLLKHTHDFSMSVNSANDTLTVSCNNNCGVTFDVKLSAENDACTGDEYVYAKASLSGLENFNALFESDFSNDSIQYYGESNPAQPMSGPPTAPGSYAAVFRLRAESSLGNGDLTLVVPFTVSAPAHDHAWSFTDITWTADNTSATGYTAKANYECTVIGCGETDTVDCTISPDILPGKKCLEDQSVTLTAAVDAADSLDNTAHSDDSKVVTVTAYGSHDLSEWSDTRPATCLVDGEKRRDCSRCDYFETDTVPAPGAHSWGFTGITWTADDTSATGYTAKANYKCTANDCDATDTVDCIISPETLPEKKCTQAQDVTLTAAVDAADSLDNTAHSDSSKVVTVAAYGAHDWNDWSDVGDGTHTRTCKRDASHTETLAHNWNGGEPTKTATCKEAGKMLFTCQDCSATKEESTGLNANNHANYGTRVENAKEAGCNEAGYTGDTVCNGCGQTLSKGETIGALGHDFGAWTQIKAASCEKDGEQRRDCSRCDAFETQAIAKLGHQWDKGQVTKEATCTEAGTIVYTCMNDASHKKTETVKALGHDWSEWKTVKEAIDEEAGLKERTCSRCDAVEQAEIPVKSGFRCGFCDKYEEWKDIPYIGWVISLVHILTCLRIN